VSTDAAAAVGDIVAAGGEHLPGLLRAVEGRLGELASGGGPDLAPPARGTIEAGGKRLRPLLLLLAAGDAAADDGRSASLVRAGCAVELVHSATLVHDDVLDAAPLRRGRPTVLASGGRAAAIQTGDFLFARAFTELVANGSVAQVRVLSDASSALARGELLQRADAFDAAISVERYTERCELKTARLFESACRLGRLCAGDPGGGDDLAVFGRRVGLAFQLLDDVLDVSGPVQRTGKHRGTDLLDGTVTLPFILARERDPELRALDPRSIATPQQAQDVCDRIAATGALELARARALALVAEAKQDLPAGGGAPGRRALELVADSVVARYS
jgi:geranylgeranyl pyrophosphate synthase